MPQAYPGAYGGGVIDFSPLTQIGEDIGGLIKSRRDKDAVSTALEQSKTPDGTYDWNKAAGLLISAGNLKSAQIVSNMAEADATARYRNESLKPDAQRLYEWAYPGGSQTAAPESQPAVPGPAPSPVQTTPFRMSENGTPTPQDFLTSRTRTSDPYTIAKEKKRAEYDAYKATKMSQAPNLKAGLRDLKAIAESVDDASFKNALGPLQGADASDIVSGYALQIPRLGGEIMNKYEGGATPPTEVRNMIAGGAQALSAAIKPLVRAPGEGIWTDRDQALLDRIVGNLAESRTKEEFYRRLQGVANRVQANFGIDLSGWDAKEGSESASGPAQVKNPWLGASQAPEIAPATMPNELPVQNQPLAGPQGAPMDRPLAPGMVVGGFRFKGGNPNDPNSWEPIQ